MYIVSIPVVPNIYYLCYINIGFVYYVIFPLSSIASLLT